MASLGAITAPCSGALGPKERQLVHRARPTVGRTDRDACCCCALCEHVRRSHGDGEQAPLPQDGTSSAWSEGAAFFHEQQFGLECHEVTDRRPTMEFRPQPRKSRKGIALIKRYEPETLAPSAIAAPVVRNPSARATSPVS